MTVILGYKNQRDAIQRHVEKFDVVKRNVKLFGRLRKDGTPTKRSQQMLNVNECSSKCDAWWQNKKAPGAWCTGGFK